MKRSKYRSTLPDSERRALTYLDTAEIDATEDVGPINQRMRAQVRGAWTPYRGTWAEVAADVEAALKPAA